MGRCNSVPFQPSGVPSARAGKNVETLPLAFRSSPEKCQHRRVTHGCVGLSAGKALVLGAFAVLGGCGGDSSATRRPSALDTAGSSTDGPAALSCDAAADLATMDAGQVSLAERYQNDFQVGVAIGRNVYGGGDAAASALVASQYNRLTPENELKWQSLQRQPGVFTFGQADAFVEYGEQHGMEIHGHTLVWHQQVPGWVFQADGGGQATREQLLERLDQHMSALSQHFGNRVQYWDVVNEAFNDDGSLRSTPWRTIIGDDYLEQAFRLAARYFPDAKLVYNDFSMENAGKRDAVVRLVQGFQARGVRIDAIGTQGHFRLQFPSLEAIEASLDAFAATGVEVLVSEMDVDVLPPANQNQGADLSVNAELSAQLNPYTTCLPSSIAEQAAARWQALFQLFRRHSDQLHSVTLWGVSDGSSWLNNWPVNGRTNYALLFNRQLQPKQSWQKVIEAADGAL
jgi:endo-1,4-beta-xylanase